MFEDKHINMPPVDLPRHNWEKQFEEALKGERMSESNFSGPTQNIFDEEEWTR